MSACEMGGPSLPPIVPFPLLGPTHTTPSSQVPNPHCPLRKTGHGDGEGSRPEEDPFLWR